MYHTFYKDRSIVILSDTHGKHRDLVIPAADIIIHCGDICQDGNESEIIDFLVWYGELPIVHKILLTGNHDYPIELESELYTYFIPEDVVLLENKIMNFDGILIGALSPNFYLEESFADNPEIKPEILVTHQAPYGILDNKSGCRELRNYVLTVRPQWHFFGHIHEQGGGIEVIGETFFVNVCNED